MASPVDEDGSAFIAATDGTVFSWHLVLQNPSLALFTDLTAWSELSFPHCSAGLTTDPVTELSLADGPAPDPLRRGPAPFATVAITYDRRPTADSQHRRHVVDLTPTQAHRHRPRHEVRSS